MVQLVPDSVAVDGHHEDVDAEVQVMDVLGTAATLVYGPEPLAHVFLKVAATALQSASVFATAAAATAVAAATKTARKGAICRADLAKYPVIRCSESWWEMIIVEISNPSEAERGVAAFWAKTASTLRRGDSSGDCVHVRADGGAGRAGYLL